MLLKILLYDLKEDKAEKDAGFSPKRGTDHISDQRKYANLLAYSQIKLAFITYKCYII